MSTQLHSVKYIFILAPDFSQEELDEITQNAVNRARKLRESVLETQKRYKIWLETGISYGIGGAFIPKNITNDT